MNYRLIATELGDLVKGDVSVNVIERAASAIFRFNRASFPNPAITSSRAQLVYDWVLSLAKQEMGDSERNDLLVSFCKSIIPAAQQFALAALYDRAGLNPASLGRVELLEFTARGFHPEVHKHARQLFLDGHYFHAVFEACKAYNKQVQAKAQSPKDGQPLMMDVWRPDGVLKVADCTTDTGRNVQQGVMFLAAGLMQAVRNPTAHEPALDWPIRKEDCLDLLSFVSFLFRQLDAAVYFKG
jgi:uncharacterized protein (TIGR02391 family)